MIELKDIHVTFNKDTPLETKALRGVDLAVPKGEFLPGIPTIEPIAIGGHEMRQLICAVGVVKLYRGR